MSTAIRDALERVATDLGAEGAEFVLERPRDPDHGDLATNLALVLAKPLRRNPRQVADEIIAALALPRDVVQAVEVAGPGFINFRLAAGQLGETLERILAAGPAWGRHEFGTGTRVNVEFVSANPTGPLHVGHGRGAALGDAIAELLEWSGHAVEREFYVNDAGVQIDRLAESLWARVQEAAGRPAAIPDGGYHGEYLREVARGLLETEGAGLAGLPDAEGIALCRAAATAAMRAEQDDDLRQFGVRFDVYTSEQGLYDTGKVEAGLAALADAGLLREAEGALWLRTSDFGDDKDRVLRKSDGSYTYLVPDIAYHVDKHARGFDAIIDVWGADHHGYVPRMRAALRALGYPEGFFDVQIVQLVKVVRGGEEVRMSKRSGEFVTLRDLVDEVGVDAARWYFLMRRGDSQLVFDVDLARSQTEENPVFYVQMAHARMSGILRNAGPAGEAPAGPVAPEGLPAPQDAELIKKLSAFPEVVERAAREREPHRTCVYLEELARLAHGWYHHCRVLGEPPAVEHARLVTARATRTVLANGLALLGVSAPDRM